VRGRTTGEAIYELLEHEPPLGFALLPSPAPGDVFFDMEGDPLYEPGKGLEYLFGCWMPDDAPEFRAFWGTDRAGERRAFEEFIDFIVARRRRYPAMHVYHYANYEKAALRRLAQEHCTREDQVDDLLRGEVLVDLFAVVRQAIAISEDGYGLKKLERFYDLKRETEVKKGDESIVMFERWLVENDAAILRDIEAYNRDDCRSTQLLRDWLLNRRDEAIAKFGVELPHRPVKRPDQPCHAAFEPACKKCVDHRNDEREEERRTDLERTLLTHVLPPQNDEEYALMHPDKRMRYLLGNLLAYHRREEKPVWWAFFDRRENADKLVEFDKDAIGGLELDRSVKPYRAGAKDRNLVYTYRFPEQHHKLAAGDDVHDPATGDRAGTIVELDDENRTLALKRAGDEELAAKISALIPGRPLPANDQKAALIRIAQAYLSGSLASATLDLLLARKPSFADRRDLAQPAEITAHSLAGVTAALQNSYLFVQGPPGSGKSTIGAQVICDLLAAGKRVGIVSTGHKAIHNLLHKVERCANERGKPFAGLYKHTKGNEESQYRSTLERPFVTSVGDNEAFDGGGYQLAAGTAWLFTREALSGSFDYVFIDEAGQVSLADALAISDCARNVVLLGDPSQLSQVSQGTHPLHAGASILEHLLGDAHTVSADRGVFLDRTYRMHPAICDFISGAVYDSRLHACPSTANQSVKSGRLTGSGLRFIALQHEGNSRESREEADRIAAEITALLDGEITDIEGRTRRICPDDIIVVTPYNAQRRLIARVLKDAGIDVRVGTVDKFQGQEASVVFYSMATSSGNDMPRDIDFLFERNRFNVAISRARALAVLVASDR
ncbi:MAG: TM0106 family RecB-like putative nuclease, partial [Candidatus Eremiobacteraeota bacterium]|nr:TM0106 family RecB-like putative nuclease [Candidatus Eremiobacteraeota bacterium]